MRTARGTLWGGGGLGGRLRVRRLPIVRERRGGDYHGEGA